MATKPVKDLARARQWHRDGQLEAALEVYRRLLDADPRQPDLLMLAAMASAQLGELEQAETFARRCVEMRSDGPACLTLGRILMQRGETDQATELFARARSDSRVAADAAFHQGQLERAAGRSEIAEQALAAAVAKAPGHAPAWNEYGLLRMDQGEYEKALVCFRHSLSHRPDDPGTLTNLAGAAIECGDLATAEQTLAAVLQRNPADATGLALLGGLHKQQGRLTESLIAWRAAVDAAPEHAGWRAGLAMTLQAMGEYEEAGAAYDHALKLMPENIDALTGRAEWLEWQGQYREGLDSLQTLDAESRQLPGPALVSARLWRRLGDPARARQILTDSIPAGGSSRRAFCFSLGDACDELGDFAQAWDWYRQGNQLTPAIFEPGAQSREAVLVEHLARQMPAGQGGSDLLFIVGLPRSGTSLLEQMLAAHPGVHGAGELPFFGELVHRVINASEAERPALLARLGNEYRRGLPAPGAGTRLISDKMPLNFRYLPLIRRVFPEARIVHCRRDLRDTGLSCLFTDFADQALGFATRLDWLSSYLAHYRQIMLKWSENYSPVFALDYERLVTSPQPVLLELLRFCGLDWDPACLEFSTQRRVTATASHAQVREPLHPRSIGRWRHYANWIGPLGELAELVDTGGQRLV